MFKPGDLVKITAERWLTVNEDLSMPGYKTKDLDGSIEYPSSKFKNAIAEVVRVVPATDGDLYHEIVLWWPHLACYGWWYFKSLKYANDV